MAPTVHLRGRAPCPDATAGAAPVPGRRYAPTDLDGGLEPSTRPRALCLGPYRRVEVRLEPSVKAAGADWQDVFYTIALGHNGTSRARARSPAFARQHNQRTVAPLILSALNRRLPVRGIMRDANLRHALGFMYAPRWMKEPLPTYLSWTTTPNSLCGHENSPRLAK